MISISVLYARRYKSHHDIFPLRVHQSKLEKMNIKLSFYNDLDKNTLNADAILISSYQANECFRLFARRKNIDLEKNNYLPVINFIRNYGLSVIWFDTSDTSSIEFPNLFENVDLYLKQQMLKQAKNSKGAFNNSNLYYDYFYGIIDKDKIQKNIKDQKNYNNVKLGWNLALSDWKIHSKNRLIRGLNIIFPSISNNLNFHEKPLKDRRKSLWFFAKSKGHIINDYHRNLLINSIKLYNDKFNLTNYNCSTMKYSKYTKLLRETAVVTSPFGLGEICYRDFEILISGCVLIKPNMDHLETWPNIYKPMKTYIPCNWDFSDLEEKVNWVFSNFSEAQTIAMNGQNYIKNILLPGNNFIYHFKNIVDIALKNPNPKTVMYERDP